ncbi:alpha/beta hydrolase family protein [Streptomyces sp. NPDC094438]|uniref:alpha/beta hydrolase family protein n=1 Tax=Streptomyces sp. NPDC094438 TaxID=3366061 RepID=UPI0037F2DBC6
MSASASRSRRVFLSTAALAVAASLTCADAAVAAPAGPPGPPAPSARMTLPAPTGAYPVGTVSLHLTDRGRPDPWVASQPYRELMVSVRYPARDVAGHPLAPQMLPGEAAGFDALNSLTDIPKGRADWAATRSHAHTDAPVARHGRRGFPVVLYSPGAGDPRTLGTTLCDDLASRGYVVVTIDHTYDATAVEFPGGRVESTVLPQEYEKASKAGTAQVTALLKKTLAVRVADTRFVLDQLGRLPGGMRDGLRGALDLNAVGMFGQSAGGFTAAQTMHDDTRLKAAADLDGVMGYTQRDDDPSEPSSVGTDGVDRPLLLMGKEGNNHHTVASWDAVWQHSSGWVRDLTLSGGEHASYTDMQSQIPQLAGPLGLSRQTVAANIGTVDPKRSVTAQEAYLAAFFDRWLRGRDGHLLDGPSARFPEIRFVP